MKYMKISLFYLFVLFLGFSCSGGKQNLTHLSPPSTRVNSESVQADTSRYKAALMADVEPTPEYAYPNDRAKSDYIGCWSAGDSGSTALVITDTFIQTSNSYKPLSYKDVESDSA